MPTSGPYKGEKYWVGKMVNPPYNYKPTIGEGLADLQKMQEAICSRLGYQTETGNLTVSR